jgi:hypothetical protein
MAPDPIRRNRRPTAALLLALALAPAAPAQEPAARSHPELPSEIPAGVVESTWGFDHERREVMIPMRDGVRLFTVLLVPKGSSGAPMLLTRTPYDADALTRHRASAHLGPTLHGYDNATDVIVEGGYIRVVQDVRGKHGSEGDYVMNRPLSGPWNPTPVDHSTDTWDTIDWLVANVPESNGRVGILGISYDGFLPLMALVRPHPALKVAVPMNPMVDGWMGDDWFHHGAFRQNSLPFIWNQEATRDGSAVWYDTHFDEYEAYLAAGTAGELARRRRLDQTGFWRKILAHPTYDAFWRDQAMDRVLAAEPLTVPVMIVHSLFDQEDIYGAIAVYEAIEPGDTGNDRVFLVMGPWSHGQMIRDGSSLGPIRWDSDTARTFRRDVLGPFLGRYLKEGAPAAAIAPVTAFETGANVWHRLDAWPSGCATGCPPRATPLYLRAGAKLAFAPPGPGEEPFAEYVSDPAKPVPYRARPIDSSDPEGWRRWLVEDQREASGRTDVVTFVSDVLTEPLRLAGAPRVHLVASTSGSDSDWVVKLIDLHPPEVAGDPRMGGYQWMVSGDIFRGRYRESFESPRPIPPGEPLPYRFRLPTVSHTFRPGHRIAVQVQSSWFPLYDRNPQTFVPSLFEAEPGDFRPATQRVWHAPGQASFVELPVVAAP